jgi:hypothetical protein
MSFLSFCFEHGMPDHCIAREFFFVSFQLVFVSSNSVAGVVKQEVSKLKSRHNEQHLPKKGSSCN